MGETLKDSSPFNVINLPEYMEGYVDDINPLIVEKLRNGEFSIQKVLDLHGLSAEDAYEEFHAFLGEAVQSRGYAASRSFTAGACGRGRGPC